jgi:hypothetical protein
VAAAAAGGDVAAMATLIPEWERAFKTKRANLSMAARTVMRSWLLEHLSNPYPTDGEKAEIAAAAGTDVEKVTTWFINARAREVPKLKAKARGGGGGGGGGGGRGEQ